MTSVPGSRIERQHDSYFLGNSRIRVEMLPKLGGRIWNLWDVRAERQWIWHNPAVPLKAPSPSVSYDDQWAGGWEELFPNDAEGEFDGRRLPDHGEWWAKSWDAEIVSSGPERAEVRLRARMTTLPASCEKTIWIERDEPRVHVRYRIENAAGEAVRFLFKQHLAVAVDPRCRIELPGGSVTPVSLDFSRRVGTPGPHPWPIAQGKTGAKVDLSTVPPPAEASREFIYVEKLPEGWCGVRHEPSGARIRMHFSLKEFPYTWMFMDFGGWKGHSMAVLEPCTNMPKELAAAAAAGRIATLGAGETFTAEASVEVSS